MSKKVYNPMPEGLDREDRPAPPPLPPPLPSEIENKEDILIKLLKSIDNKLSIIIDNMPHKNNGFFGPG